MNLSKKQTIPFLFLILAIVIIGLWTGPDNSVGNTPEPDPGYGNNTGVPVTPVQAPACHGYTYPVQAGGDVYIGESCLNVSAAVSSGQVISWYKNGRMSGDDRPDESRIVHDAQNFFVNPDEFLGFRGPWYVGTTDRVAFVVNNAMLNTLLTTSDSPGYYKKLDPGVLAIINSTNQIDYARVWVVLEEPAGIQKDPRPDMTQGERGVFWEQQRAYYLNLTKPVVDYVRSRGFIVDYIGQTSPAIEVLAPPSFMKELAQRPEVQKIVTAKASHQLIKTILLCHPNEKLMQCRPDETMRIMVSFTKPPEVTRFLHTTSLNEDQIQEYYSKNRVYFENHTRPILDLLEKENISIRYSGPYPTGGFWAEIPVRLIEEFNARPEVAFMEREIPAHII